jgi:3-deoxy-7-phosphoheptulonate synthase
MTLTAVPALDEHRTARISPLLSPALLRHELPVDAAVAETVTRARAEVVDILDGRDDRLIVVVGPCSIHDPDAAMDYAGRLAAHTERVAGELRVVMRTYFEKPRSTVGWKGLINDPGLDGTYDVNTGLRTARRLLLDVSALGLPVGCEFLDPIIPQFLADVVSWGAIGARTAASQVHRQLCSALSMPVGIKNPTDGDVQVAIDGVPDCHVILRGGSGGPNHDAASVAATLDRLRAGALPARMIVDASHGNSGKDHVRQAGVVHELAERIGAGEPGIAGVMMESFLVGGRQDLGPTMTRGQSITDACMDWDTTAALLDELATAVTSRRR